MDKDREKDNKNPDQYLAKITGTRPEKSGQQPEQRVDTNRNSGY
jgi:hypothetical protein